MYYIQIHTHTHKKKSTPVLLKGYLSNLVFTVSQEVEESDSHKIMQRVESVGTC